MELSDINHKCENNPPKHFGYFVLNAKADKKEGRMKKISIICIVLVILLAGISFAAEEKENIVKKIVEGAFSPIETILGPVTELGKIVVTPSKIEEKLGAQSSVVTVLDELDFEEMKVDYVKSALKEKMGLDVVESGAFTGQTSVFMRGANSNQTLIMIDGIKVYDPIASNGAYNLAHLTLDNVGQIEIVRGPQSALYGSDAIGGVINIITKKAEKTFVSGSFEAGSFSTFREAFNVGSKVESLHYTVGGSVTKSRGISTAQAKNNNPELDGFERYSISTRVDYDINDNCTLGGTFRNTSTLFDYDQFRVDYPNLRQRDYESLFTTYIEHRPIDLYSYYVKCGWMYNFRRDVDSRLGSSYYDLRDWYEGYQFRLDYRNNFHLFDITTFTIGYEYMQESGDYYYNLGWGSGDTTDDMPKVFDRNSSLYLQNRINYHDRLTATQGMRVDNHSQAGTHISYKLDGSYLFQTGTKVRGGWATGFKAPTLYQLNAVSSPSDAWGWGGFGGGNPDLKPETSSSYEMGIDQYLFGEKALLHITYFHTMIRDLINTTTNEFFYTSQFENTGKAHSHGVECGLRLAPTEDIELKGDYTYDYTKDYSTDRPLLRRPLHKFKISGFWRVLPNLDTGIEIMMNGLRYDVNIDKLKPYAVVNLNADYRITKNFSAYIKFVNLFNKRYEEVRGFGTSPFAVYAGTKAEF